MRNKHVRLTSGGRLARNTVWNLIGSCAPLVVAALTIPPIINGLGTDRFGVLTLAWAVIGYFSLFDLGIGRALTQMVAEKLGAGREDEVRPIVWTSLFLMLVSGTVGTFVLGIFSRSLVIDILKIPAALQTESIYAFYALAVSVPIVVTTAGLRGVLEAYQHFGLVNAIRVPLGILTFLGPFIVLPFSNSLFVIVAVLVAGRVVATVAHLLACFHVNPALRNAVILQRSAIKTLLHFGGWMTVTNIVSPVMVYLDRFMIGAIISIAAAAYYTAPYEVVTKLLLIPSAIMGVLFPAFAFGLTQDRNRTAQLFHKGIKYVFLALFPLTLSIVTFAHEGLKFWLGDEFAQNSTHVLQWIAIGVLINGLAQIPFALIQGAGRPDLTAKLHLIELPIYLVSVWWLVGLYGIEGAAISWVGRVAVDAVLLFFISWRFIPRSRLDMYAISVIAASALLFTAFAIFPDGFVLKGILLLVMLPVFAMITWFVILDAEERVLVGNFYTRKVIKSL